MLLQSEQLIALVGFAPTGCMPLRGAPTCLYKESCGFVGEDFPKENQKLANRQLNLV
jgi:hypothetical protein